MLDAVEVVADEVKCLGDPRVTVPIVLSLSLDLGEVLQSLDHLIVLQEFYLFEAQQDLIGGQSVPVDFLRVIQEDLLSFRWIPLVSDAHGDGEREGELSPWF